MLAIATTSLIGTTLIGHGLWIVMLAGLGFLQFRRIIEGMDLAIIAGVTMAIVVAFERLRSVNNLERPEVIVIALMAGGAMIIVAVVFRLIFRLLSEIM